MPTEYERVEHQVDADDATHSAWNNALEPVLTVEPGAVIQFECTDATGGQLDSASTVADLAELDVDAVHTLTGPIAIVDAVATLTNDAVTELPPLYGVVDSEALAELVASSRARNRHVEVSFTYQGCHVTVSSRGDIVVVASER